MDNKNKLVMLENILDIEEGTLNEDMELSDIDNWDSLAIMSLIALIDSKFNKTISAIEIKKFKYVRDILNEMCE